MDGKLHNEIIVSTHSRPKAAADDATATEIFTSGFNTQPPEGGCLDFTVALNSLDLFQHTAARRRLPYSTQRLKLSKKFQHTAARRRLLKKFTTSLPNLLVSTHSRPKAAAAIFCSAVLKFCCFNTQPPEGGCAEKAQGALFYKRFNTQPPEGGCLAQWFVLGLIRCFNTQPPEGGCKNN